MRLYCTVYILVIVRKDGQRQPHLLVLAQLHPEARSRRLKLCVDAVDDHNILRALLDSACSTI